MGSVGREGSQFESSHRQTLYCLFAVICIEKAKRKEKRPGFAQFLIRLAIFSGDPEINIFEKKSGPLSAFINCSIHS